MCMAGNFWQALQNQLDELYEDLVVFHYVDKTNC